MFSFRLAGLRERAALIKEGVEAGPKRKTLIFVNNRMEGNALATIAAMISAGGEGTPG